LLVWVANDREPGEVGPGVGGAVVAELAVHAHPATRVEHFCVDEVRSVKIRIFCEAFNQARCRIVRDDRFEDGGGVDDEHRCSVAVASSADGGDDRVAVRATGGRTRALEDDRDRWAPGDALELAERGCHCTEPVLRSIPDARRATLLARPPATDTA
jgi:hypothetical protein